MNPLCKYRSFFTLCAAFLVWGAPVRAETLMEAVEEALGNNPTLDVAASRFEAARHEQDMEESGVYPEISASVTLGRVYQDNATSRGLSVDRGAAYSGYGEGMVALRQSIFDGNETSNRIEAAKARVRSFESNIADVRERLLFRVTSAYLEVMRSRAALDYLKQQRASMVSYHERILAMVEEGVSDESEAQQAQDVVIVMNGLVNDYESALKIAEADYKEVTGRMPGESLVRPASLRVRIPQDLSAEIQAVISSHPALKAAEMESKAAKMDLEAQKAGYFPDVTGELSYLRSDKKDVIGGEVEDARAVVRMNWIFATGGEQEASVERSSAEYRGAQAQLEELRRSLEKTVTQAYADLKTFTQKRDLAVERVTLNEKLLSNYKLQFESARVGLLHLMRAESQLYKARIELSDARYRGLLSEYAVQAAQGTLDRVLMSGEKAEAARKDKAQNESMDIKSAESVPQSAEQTEPAAGQSREE